jgi:hypothetical protein
MGFLQIFPVYRPDVISPSITRELKKFHHRKFCIAALDFAHAMQLLKIRMNLKFEFYLPLLEAIFNVNAAVFGISLSIKREMIWTIASETWVTAKRWQ